MRSPARLRKTGNFRMRQDNNLRLLPEAAPISALTTHLRRARTRAEDLTWPSILGTRALPPHLSAHGPVVRLAGAARTERHLEGRGDLGAPARGCGPAPSGRPAAEHHHLMPQHHDLRFLGRLTATEKDQPAEHPDHDQVHQTDRHEPRSCPTPPATPNRSSGALRRVLERYTVRSPANPATSPAWIAVTSSGPSANIVARNACA
jgi:hypothetical protein